MRVAGLALSLTAIVFVSSAHGSITIVNPGFSADTIPVTAPGLAFTNLISSWTITGNQGAGVLTTDPANPGGFSGVLSDSPGDPDHQNAYDNLGYISQELGTPLAANQTYVLTADIGQRSDTLSADGYPGGGIFLGYGSTSGTNLLTAGSVIDPQPASGGWSVWTSTFSTGPSPAGLGQDLRIDLLSNGIQMQFDNINLTATSQMVPEPPSQVFWGLITACVFAACRRTQR
jgi:hypothetical protein